MSKTSSINPLMEVRAETIRQLGKHLHGLVQLFRDQKPNDRSEEDRQWAILITQLEQAESTFLARILPQNQLEEEESHE